MIVINIEPTLEVISPIAIRGIAQIRGIYSWLIKELNSISTPPKNKRNRFTMDKKLDFIIVMKSFI